MSKTQAVIDVYLEIEKPARSTFDVLEWWKTNSMRTLSNLLWEIKRKKMKTHSKMKTVDLVKL